MRNEENSRIETGVLDLELKITVVGLILRVMCGRAADYEKVSPLKLLKHERGCFDKANLAFERRSSSQYSKTDESILQMEILAENHELFRWN